MQSPDANRIWSVACSVQLAYVAWGYPCSTVYALDLKTGRPQWNVPFEGVDARENALVTLGNKTTLLIFPVLRVVEGRNSTMGKKLWSREVPFSLSRLGVVSDSKNTVFITGRYTSRVTAIDVSTGETRWQTEMGKQVGILPF